MDTISFPYKSPMFVPEGVKICLIGYRLSLPSEIVVPVDLSRVGDIQRHSVICGTALVKDSAMVIMESSSLTITTSAPQNG